MGLLDSVIGAATQALGDKLGTGGQGQASGDVLSGLLGMLSNDGGQGGLSGLIEKFQQGGLGELAASWVGKGDNLPVSAEQISQVLGSDTVSSLAARFGVDPAQASQLISQHLPGLVDRLTPDGQAPQGGLGSLAELAGQFLNRG
jgi:uncharacterized protein YidB (DUF937 family)